jgi:phosphatidylglycerophosphatase A
VRTPREEQARAWKAVRTPSGFVASVGGIGLIPYGPGTWASAAALPLGWLLMWAFGTWGLAAGALAIFLLGIAAAGRVVGHMEIEDPSLVVIDEIAGQLLTLMAAPLTWQWYLASFVAFRIFDLAKPWPASWADREVPGGFGAMLDDMIAAAYGFLTIFVLVYFLGA